MQFQREIATPELCEELLPLLHEHWKEIAHYQDIPLKPDFEAYLNMEKAGCLRVFTARTAFDELVGYSIFFVRPNMHYSSSLQAVQDILFVHPNHRGVGTKLIIWSDKMLAAEGVQAVYHHVKAAHNFGSLLERLGYQLVDLIYARRLDTKPAENEGV